MVFLRNYFDYTEIFYILNQMYVCKKDVTDYTKQIRVFIIYIIYEFYNSI